MTTVNDWHKQNGKCEKGRQYLTLTLASGAPRHETQQPPHRYATGDATELGSVFASCQIDVGRWKVLW